MSPDVLEVPVAFVDARAADLRLHLGLPPQAALALGTVDGQDWSAELRILGASHQVLIHQRGRAVLSETVACHLIAGPPCPAPLPGRYRADSGYEFRSEVAHLAPADFRRTVEEVLRHNDDTGPGLCARFPGDELATTVIRLDLDDRHDGGGISWRTWHTYPRAGEVVTTVSRFTPAADSSAGRT